MAWTRLALYAALAAALLAGFVLCRKRGEHAAGLNLAVIQLIFGGLLLPACLSGPWTDKGVEVLWLEWGLWSALCAATLVAGTVCAAVSIARLVKAGKNQ